MYKNKGKKSNRPHKWTKRIPHYMIAEVTGISENTIKAVRNGHRSKETTLGQKIEVAEILLEEGLNHLLKEVKRILKS